MALGSLPLLGGRLLNLYPRSQLQEGIHYVATRPQKSTEPAAQSARRPRAMINDALIAATTSVQTRMNATSLGSLSNQVARATTINRSSLASLASLDASETLYARN